MPKSAVVGSISLYGTHATGFGWLATYGDPDTTNPHMLGTGDPDPGASATEAVWSANSAIFLAREAKRLPMSFNSLVEIHIDTASGPLMATAPIGRVPRFGDLKFGPGRTYTVSAEEIERAADQRAYDAHWTARVPEFREEEFGGAFDGSTVTSDAAPGL